MKFRFAKLIIAHRYYGINLVLQKLQDNTSATLFKRDRPARHLTRVARIPILYLITRCDGGGAMEYGYSLEVASPPAGRVLEELRAFLTGAGLGFA